MRNRARSRSTAITGLFTAALLTGSAFPAAAGPDTDYAMGSQIRLHEHGSRTYQVSGAVRGIDVSGHQRNMDWAAQWKAGKRFVWVKATQNINFTNDLFDQQYSDSDSQGFTRGAYHFAIPSASSGAAQAKYFLANGGGWSADGHTLPGALDVEYNPSGPTCYGLSKAGMGSWIQDFSTTYKKATGKYPIIYTSTSWWNQCVSGNFSGTNPLWTARYTTVGSLPADWHSYTVWQYSKTPLDQDVFNGSADQLKALATRRD